MSMGINVPDWMAYGPVAIIAVLSLHYYAYAYLLVSAALNSINLGLRKWRRLGAPARATICKITLRIAVHAVGDQI